MPISVSADVVGTLNICNVVFLPAIVFVCTLADNIVYEVLNKKVKIFPCPVQAFRIWNSHCGGQGEKMRGLEESYES